MRELKGWHVLVIILAFFGVTIGVNTIFVSYALSTFSGEDVKQPYLKGLGYNRTLAQREAQAALGWSASIGARRATDGAGIVHVDITTGARMPVDALDVTATLRHPVDARLDREVVLRPMPGGGYEARVPGLARGQWDVVARTRSTDNTVFEATRRVVVP